MASRAFSIGTLASHAGVNVETIRYYHRRGLLEQPERPLGGTRRYGDSHLARLRSIRGAQAMGFTLEEVAELLADHGASSCAHTRALAERKLEEVRRRIAELDALAQALRRATETCAKTTPGQACPVLHSLGDVVSVRPATPSRTADRRIV